MKPTIFRYRCTNCTLIRVATKKNVKPVPNKYTCLTKHMSKYNKRK